MPAPHASPAITTARPQRSAFAGQVVYFVGVGGCGMSGLARLLSTLGAECSGSDGVPNPLTSALETAGIPVTDDQSGAALPATCDLVVASAAIRADHPELLAAEARGVPVISYAEALGRAQAERTGISIAGTHGKSTTSAMLCHVLLACGLDPGFIVGATCDQIGGGSRCGAASIPGDGPLSGRPGLLIAEACEFNRSFHQHQPVLGLINNIEADHLDVYGSLEHLVTAFAEFARLIPPAKDHGRLLIAHDSPHRLEVTAGLDCDVKTFGPNVEADYQVFYDAAARRVGLLRDGHWLGQWTQQMAGTHNAMNAAAAAIMASWIGAEWSEIGDALTGFEGLDRRMQCLGQRALPSGLVTVYDDYGHHPTEIDATLRALLAAERPDRLICVFQPHQHSRTRFLLDAFAQSFSAADVVIVPHIYFVRDSQIEKTKVSAGDLVDRLRQRGITALHLYPFDAIVDHLELMCRGGDLLVIMGAGPVWEIARDYLDRGEGDSREAEPC